MSSQILRQPQGKKIKTNLQSPPPLFPFRRTEEGVPGATSRRPGASHSLLESGHHRHHSGGHQPPL